MTILSNAMTVTVDQVQWGVQKYPYQVNLRRVMGQNQGVALDGSTIYDILVIKRDLSVRLLPMDAETISSLAASYESNIVEVSFFNPLHNAMETMNALVSFGPISLGIKGTNKEIYEGIDVTFQEV